MNDADDFIRGLKDRMRMASWLHMRETDKRTGAEIVRDSLETVRHELVNVLGAAGAANRLRALADSIERDADVS